MKTFNDNAYGDVITFEMRVKEASRQMLHSMFMASDEHKKMLDKAMDQALKSFNVQEKMKQEAEKAIYHAIESYFQVNSPGGYYIKNVMYEVMDNIVPEMFKGKVAKK